MASPNRSISRALPSGGPSSRVPPLALSTVDKPNPNAKFGRVQPPKSNQSTAFSNAGPVPSPRFGKKCNPGAAGVRSAEVSPRSTLKISRLDEKQAAAAKHREDNPRTLRRHSDHERPDTSRCVSPNKMANEPVALSPTRKPLVVTSNGLEYSGGRKVSDKKFATSMGGPAPAAKDYKASPRFVNSGRSSPSATCVLNPETLPNHVPPPKNQRFASSPQNRHTTLTGVFHSDTGRPAPPAYTPRAPYHTE
jgi:hypothetical protein